MFKLRNIYILPILTLLLLLLFPKGAINAAKIEVGDYTLDKQSIVEDDLYVSGDTITISGVVDGDLIVTGKHILVDGTITGDLYVFGTSVSVAGNIYGNLIAAGTSVGITGTVRENVYTAAMMVDMDGSFNRDIAVLSGAFRLKGAVADDVRVAAGQISSTATVGGDFLAGSETYTIDENDIIGELIAGTENTKKTLVFERTDQLKFSKSDFLGFNIGLAIVNFIGMYIVGILLILSAPVKTLQIEKRIIGSWEEFVKSYAIGLVVLFTVPIPIFLLIITLVGAPLAFLATGVLLFLAIFGTIWTESAIGQKVLQLSKRKDSGRFLSLLIGRGISVVVRLIPVINALYSLSLVVVTVGSVVRTKYDAFAASREVGKKNIEKKK